MEQVHVIEKITDLFLQKLKTISAESGEPMEILLADGELKKTGSRPSIYLKMLGIEENTSQNMCNKIQFQEHDANGTLIEYFVEPPTLIDIKYMVIPYVPSSAELFKILGMIIKLIKEDGFIAVDGFDWHENNGNPVKVYTAPNMSLERQTQIFNLLRLEYTPALFYQLTVGINSTKKEIFRRVEEKRFDLLKKKG